MLTISSGSITGKWACECGGGVRLNWSRSVPQADSAYGSANSLKRHGSALSLTSSTLSGSGGKWCKGTHPNSIIIISFTTPTTAKWALRWEWKQYIHMTTSLHEKRTPEYVFSIYRHKFPLSAFSRMYLIKSLFAKFLVLEGKLFHN